MELSKDFNPSVLKKKEIFALLLLQIEKDFELAGIPFLELKKLSPDNLIFELSYFLEDLLKQRKNAIYQLLYTLDISEQEVNKALFDGINSNNNYKTLALLILQRVWKKIYFRTTLGQ